MRYFPAEHIDQMTRAGSEYRAAEAAYERRMVLARNICIGCAVFAYSFTMAVLWSYAT